MLKWGILGCGKIANKFAEDLALAEGSELYAVASRSGNKAQLFAKEHGASTFYKNYQALCDDPAVDIIYVATPHNSHLQYGLMVMEAGKHLLCEKPLAVNEAQVSKLVYTARSNGVFMMEAMWSRFNPSIEEVKQKIVKGEVGAITYINADFNFQLDYDPTSRLYNPELAGGALLDIGVYPLFLSYLILGQPKEIISKAHKHENGVDVQTSAILHYENAQAILNFGLCNSAKMDASVNGEKGSYIFYPRWHETQGYSTFVDGMSKEFPKPTIGKGFTYEIQECEKCINCGKVESSKWSHDDSLNLIKMCDEIRRQNGITYPFE